MPKLKSVNPSNYQILGKVDVSSAREVEEKVNLARNAQKEWGDLGVAARVEILRKAMEEFDARKDEFALQTSREMGMPIGESAANDIGGGLDFAKHYLDNAGRYLAVRTTFENETEHRVSRESIGVAAVIIPWNYPFLMFIWDALPSLIAGNTVVMKHSEECPLMGKMIEEVMTRHLPKGVFGEVYGAGDVGQMLVNQDVNLIVFTGSTKTGKALYETAGKKFVRGLMECGGSAPGIVFGDADIDAAVRSICEFRLSNAGQYCDGLKRLIAHRNVFYEVVGKLSDAFSARKIGAAEKPSTELGPLAAKRQLKLLVEQVKDAKEKGANVITGGNSLSWLGGAFHEPTVLTGITTDMRVWKEEVFGPVLPVVEFRTEEEAIRLANDTAYGLGGYIYTADMKRAMRVARQIKSGMVSINGANYTTPFNPFGGYKNSGMGRQHGQWGFNEVTQVKVVAKPK